MGIHIMSGRKLIEKTENPSNVPEVLFLLLKIHNFLWTE